VGAVTHQTGSSGGWLLGVILTTLVFWFFFLAGIPPWLQKGRSPSQALFLGLWVSAAIGALVFQFVGFSIVRILLGGSQEEWRQHIDFLSFPLALMDRNFQLTPAHSFFDLCGVLVGNAFFYALSVYLCYHPVRSAFRRNLPTRLSISELDPEKKND
jgi:uncharacterized membrane protein required for colicin V production